MSKYARYLHDFDANGNKELSLDVVTDMIHEHHGIAEVFPGYYQNLRSGHKARVDIFYRNIKVKRRLIAHYIATSDSKDLREIALAGEGEDRRDLRRAVVGVDQHVLCSFHLLTPDVFADGCTHFLFKET